MNKEIAKILRDELTVLDWVDVAAGLVRTVKTNDRMAFPVDVDVYPDGDPATLSHLVPDDSRITILYFEDIGFRTQREGRWVRCTSDLRLVCWINGKKVAYTSAQAIKGVLRVLYGLGKFNRDDFGSIVITSIVEEEKSSGIFSKYSYSEEQTQYLMHPNDYFAIRVSLEYLVAVDCFTNTDVEYLDECGNPVPFNYCEQFLSRLSQRQIDCVVDAYCPVFDFIDSMTVENNEDFGTFDAMTI